MSKTGLKVSPKIKEVGMTEQQKIILHIEDTETDAEIVKRALQKHMKHAYRVERAKSMAEAESILRTVSNIDLILLDLGLPDTNDRMDTFQRLESAKKRNSDNCSYKRQ